jgi:hypothetical protein
VQKHPTWSGRAAGLVACRQIDIGMTADQVRAAWGKPDELSVTQLGSSRTEMWTYGTNLVFLKDSIVTSFNSSR